MRIPVFARNTLGISGAVALLSGCGGSQGFIGQSISTQTFASTPSNATGERVLYRFKGGRDGSHPRAALLDVNGTLFGTTAAGGGSYCISKNVPTGCGTIFSIDTSGSGYNVIHRYSESGKGGAGSGKLTFSNGQLYGTTGGGGNFSHRHGTHRSAGCAEPLISGCGTIFKMDQSGSPYDILYRFAGAPDGTHPSTPLLDVNGTFYGATGEGGAGKECSIGSGGGGYSPIPGCGTLYEVSPTSGKARVLYKFPGYEGSNFRKGLFPDGMINVNGTLYGTTILGGLAACGGPSGWSGCGTIFTINPSGDGYHVVYRFRGHRDGGRPNSVINVNGTLYGTTVNSQSAGCVGFHGCDTLFKFDIASGRETVLHRFRGGRDGLGPNGPLTYANGNLYGTTVGGGDSRCYFAYGGCGTVFKFDIASGREQVLYRFRGGSDGISPTNGVIEVNGVLYGTTAYGGTNDNGTVFSLSP